MDDQKYAEIRGVVSSEISPSQKINYLMGVINEIRNQPNPVIRGEEPTENQIHEVMEDMGKTYYGAREYLREKAYGGKPPTGYDSWGMYWKSL